MADGNRELNIMEKCVKVRLLRLSYDKLYQEILTLEKEIDEELKKEGGKNGTGTPKVE